MCGEVNGALIGTGLRRRLAAIRILPWLNFARDVSERQPDMSLLRKARAGSTSRRKEGDDSIAASWYEPQPHCRVSASRDGCGPSVFRGRNSDGLADRRRRPSCQSETVSPHPQPIGRVERCRKPELDGEGAAVAGDLGGGMSAASRANSSITVYTRRQQTPDGAWDGWSERPDPNSGGGRLPRYTITL
jgi:hypothetical protein